MDCKHKNKDNCQTDLGRGCSFCHCGEELTASMCEGCFKLHAYDWLEGLPEGQANDIFEIRFKNTRKGYYQNVNNLELKKGDIVAVEASPGHDIGIVSLTGDMVGRQMRRVGFNPQNGEFKKIYRKAKPYDIEKWQEAIGMEHETMILSRQIAADMRLNMKIGDVEYQGDRIKAIFYYIADERVDFRELIKVFADRFRIRVEMKQIGARQEAGRIGGLGSCGRELCCASWISGFVSVTTNAARHQEISLNPQKLAGQCGKLKCCLVYELDTYMDARKEMPRVHQPLQALDGDYFLVKSDILGRTMSFSTSQHEMANLVTLPVERVREIIDLNRKGQKVDRLTDYSVQVTAVREPDYMNVVGEESITRFDRQGGKNRGKRHGRGGRDGQEGGDAQSGRDAQGAGEARQSGGGNLNNRSNRTEGGRSADNRGGERRGNNNNRQNAPRNGGDRQRNNEPRPDGENRQNAENRQGGEHRSAENRNARENRSGGGRNNRPSNGDGNRGGGRNENRNAGRGEGRGGANRGAGGGSQTNPGGNSRGNSGNGGANGGNSAGGSNQGNPQGGNQ